MNEAVKLQAYREQWNVPDWRDENAYAYLKNLRSEQKRWEFLRRMPEYRVAWTNRHDFIGSEFGLHEMCNPVYRGDNPEIAGQTLYPHMAGKMFNPESYREQFNAMYPKPALIQLAKNSGYYRFFDDAEQTIVDSAMPTFAEVVGEAVLELISHGYSLFIFDKNLPLNQCDKAKDQLKQLKADCESPNQQTILSTNRKPRNDFNEVSGLRALDAYNEYVSLHGTDEGLNQTQIASVIYPEKYGDHDINKYFEYSLKTAKKYAYRGIFLI